MNKLFYPKMALSNMNKNRKTYFPFILTCILTIMMYYMMDSILHNESIRSMKGGMNICILLNIGLWITGIFAVVFLFYTNSFLIKRRNKEIGLYNILGMEKRHIGRMMFYETLFTACISIALGLILGVVFSKLMFLLLIKLIGASTMPAFEIPGVAVGQTLILTLCIFLAILFYNLLRIHMTKPIELIHGGQIGEKEPKTKIIMTIIGILTLGGGYYFGITVKSPFAAVTYFLLAVILVIIGTYCLFTAGSIALIKLLKKNKKFYYKAKHFTTVSGMMFRMKQNAVGLANICILSTMVLISISTTVSLFLGAEDAVKSSCPSEMNLMIKSEKDDAIDQVKTEVNRLAKEQNIEIKNMISAKALSLYSESQVSSNTFEIIKDEKKMDVFTDKLSALMIIDLDDFNQVNNTHYTLNKGEVLLYSKKNYNYDDLQIKTADHTLDFKVVDQIHKLSSKMGISQSEAIIGIKVVVVDSKETMMDIFAKSNEGFTEEDTIQYMIDSTIQFDTNLSEQDSRNFNSTINKIDIDGIMVISDNQYASREDMHQSYGSFLFIGIFVGSLFLMATVLIIYYKQISEGYDDKERFEIMQKVGMSRAEVRKSIRSQVLTVFYMPLAVATLHVVVSFRIIKYILNMLSLGNTELFIWCTFGTVLVFCIIYALVFKITEKSYYNIVSRS